MDGYVTIGASLDTKQFNMDIKDLEKELKSLDKEEISLTKQRTKEEESIEDTQRTLALYQEMVEKQLEIAESEEEVNQIRQNEETLIELSNLAIENSKENINSINGKLEENKQKHEAITNEIKKQQKELANSKGLENLSKGLTNVVTKVGKWGLALIGIRSVYSFISSSMHTIAQYDKQLGADIQYIKTSLAFALKPVIEFIIQLILKLLKILQTIIYKWTGYNIFKDSNEGLKQGVKSAKQLKKQLAGFDEMNVLNDDGSVGGLGGTSIKPSVDFSQIDEELVETLSFDNMKKTINNLFDKIQKYVNDWLKDDLGGLISQDFKNKANELIDRYRTIFLQIIDLTELYIKLIKDIFTGNWSQVWEDIKNITKTTINILINQIVSMANQVELLLWNIYDVAFRKPQEWFEGLKKNISTKLSEIWQIVKTSLYVLVVEIGYQVSKIPQFFVNLKNKISTALSSLGTKIGDALSSALKKAINVTLSYIETKINNAINMINKITGGVNNLFGTKIGKISIVKLPRLAKGGIVNMPGRGVPIGGAIAGEKGQEGVIPLTDSQQMRLLGEAIGKYITINATITNTMNGRVISKEIQRINNDNEFIYNG